MLKCIQSFSYWRNIVCLAFAFAILTSCENQVCIEDNNTSGGEEILFSDEIIEMIRNIDQLRTFSDENNKPIKILVANDIVNGNRIMRLFVLDNNNMLCQEVNSYNKAPCLYYEDFVGIDYTDINRDGKKDIIIDAKYSTGVGPQGMDSQIYRIIYIQSENGYIADEDKGPVLLSDPS